MNLGAGTADRTCMDLNSVLSLSSAAATSRVQYAVAAKVLQSQMQQGDAAVKLVQAATQGIEQQIQSMNDANAEASNGGGLDMYA